jgi:ABC-type glycerol-3-phosphate transport system substrate-binding protein
MKKIATLALISAAALSLAACGDKTSSNTVTTIDNETVLNSEEAPLDNLGGADLLGNSADNVSVDATTKV